MWPCCLWMCLVSWYHMPSLSQVLKRPKMEQVEISSFVVVRTVLLKLLCAYKSPWDLVKNANSDFEVGSQILHFCYQKKPKLPSHLVPNATLLVWNSGLPLAFSFMRTLLDTLSFLNTPPVERRKAWHYTKALALESDTFHLNLLSAIDLQSVRVQVIFQSCEVCFLHLYKVGIPSS